MNIVTADLITGNLIGTINGTPTVPSLTIFTETGTVGTTHTLDIAQAGGDIVGSILLLFIIGYLLFQVLRLEVEEEV